MVSDKNAASTVTCTTKSDQFNPVDTTPRAPPVNRKSACVATRSPAATKKTAALTTTLRFPSTSTCELVPLTPCHVDVQGSNVAGRLRRPRVWFLLVKSGHQETCVASRFSSHPVLYVCLLVPLLVAGGVDYSNVADPSLEQYHRLLCSGDGIPTRLAQGLDN